MASEAPPTFPPKQQLLLQRSGTRTMALVLVEGAVELGMLGQRPDHGGLAQAAVPKMLLPEQAVQQLHRWCRHFHAAAPHPQWTVVIHLEAGERQ